MNAPLPCSAVHMFSALTVYLAGEHLENVSPFNSQTCRLHVAPLLVLLVVLYC